MFSYRPNLRSKNGEFKKEHLKVDFAILSAMQEELEYFYIFLSRNKFNWTLDKHCLKSFHLNY